jgi:phosphonate transport system substrate-binding protein
MVRTSAYRGTVGIGSAKHPPPGSKRAAGWLAGGLALFAACAAAVSAAAEPPSSPAPALTLAVVPQRPPLETYENWSPLAERLSRQLGVAITLKVYRDFPSFEEDLLKGRPALVFMNPYHQVLAYRAQKYLPLVRSSRPLTGILVVRRDAPIRRLEELDGKTLVFPSHNAFGASLYLRALLSERYKLRYHAYFVGSHDDVYRHVILADADVGGGLHYTLLRQPPPVRAQLRVIYETPTTVSHSLAAHPRHIDPALRAALTSAILALWQEPEGMTLLERVQLGAPAPADYRRDYAPLERLRLEKYAAGPDKAPWWPRQAGGSP